MRHCLLAIISIWFFHTAAAQDEVDTTDSARLFQPRLYWDYGKTLMLWSTESQKHEGGLELLIMDRIQLIGEGGFNRYTPTNVYKNIEYESSGTFYRVGIGYLGYLDDKNRIGLGARYGASIFSDQGFAYINSTSGLNQPLADDFNRDDLEAKWMELVINSEKYVRLNKNDQASLWNKRLSLGLMIRYKILLEYPDYEPIEVFAIPGYGRTVNKRVMAFNLFLKINI